LEVSCSVTPFHLYFTDAEMVHYDPNLKVYPPLRDQASVKTLQKAILDGIVDCIATHHLPHEYDSKVVEFEYAKPGMTGLETAYAALHTVLPELGPEKIVDLLSVHSRKIFGLDQPLIAEGQPCALTLFDPAGSTQIMERTTRSRSKNTPFIGKELKGRVVGIINGGKFVLNEA
jgi:dihydroorotase